MRFNTYINNVKCIEWGISANQGALVNLIFESAAWAEHVKEGDSVYYHISRNLVCKELPLFYTKPDTVYRSLKKLSEIGVVEYRKIGLKDCVKITPKGKSWNSGAPAHLGNESEPTRKQIRANSEMNPTYNKTSYNNKKEKETISLQDLKPREDDRVPVAHWGGTWTEFEQKCPNVFIETTKAFFPNKDTAKIALKQFYDENMMRRSMFPEWKWKDILVKNLQKQKERM